MWRLHKRKLFQRSYTVERLPVHLQEQMLFFRAGREADADLDKQSKLMAYFKLNNENMDVRQYYYQEIPEHFTWKKGEWKVRKNTRCIGPIYTVSPADTERLLPETTSTKRKRL